MCFIRALRVRKSVSGPVVRYRLPEKVRPRLKRPLAPVVDEEGLLELERSGKLGRPLVCVGDIVCDTLLRLDLSPEVLVFDLVTLRGDVPSGVEKRLTSLDTRIMHVRNPAATITKELEDAILDALASGRPTRIQVDGEEDLAGLPVLIHAPMGATMIYGMPNQGLVPVPVTEESREVAGAILSLMRVGPDGAVGAPDGPTEGG